MKRIMNLNKWILLAILATVSLTFASCGSDDDDDNKGSDDLASAMVGTYTGEITTIAYSGTTTIKVTKVSNTSVKIEVTAPNEAANAITPITSNIRAITDDMITSADGAIVTLLYAKGEKTLRLARTMTPAFAFEGTKN